MLNSNTGSTSLNQRCDPDDFTGQNWEGGQIGEADSYLVKEKVLLTRTTWKRDRLPVSY